MSGSMRERSRGVWELRVSVGKDPVTGRYRQKSKTVTGSKRAAKAELAKFVTELQGQVIPTRGTFGHLLDSWLERSEATLSPTTLKEYRRIIAARLKPALGGRPLDQLTVHDFDDLYAALRKEGLSPSSINQIHAVARRSLTMAVRWGWVDRNPTEHSHRPPMRSADVAPPTVPELRSILEHAEAKDADLAVLLRVAAAIGARRGEMCGLQWRDVDLDAGVIRISRAVVEVDGELVVKGTKTHQARSVSIDSETVALLRSLRAEMDERAQVDVRSGRLVPEAFVWSREPDGGRPLPPSLVSRSFSKAAKAAGVKARLHDLRHLSASLQLSSGVPLATVSKRLGHRRQSTTSDIYSHALPSDDAIAADVLGRLLYGERPELPAPNDD